MLLARISRPSPRDGGQVLVFFALLLPVLFALGAIVLSVGNWYVHKRHLQTQVDAAALASGPQFTGCYLNPTDAETEIVEYALAYAGDTRRDPATTNLQVQEPDDVYAVLNSSSYWAPVNGTDPANPSPGYGLDFTMPAVDGNGDPTANGTSRPCDTKFLDVKATDEDAPLLWRVLPLHPDPKTHAKVQIHKLQGLSGFLPWAVPENRPRTVAALFVDETRTNTVDSVHLLTPPTDPDDTDVVNGEDVAVWDGLAQIDLTGQEETGMIILSSRQLLTYSDLDPAAMSLSEMCAMAGTVCFGSIRNQSPPVTNDMGLAFVFGQQGTPNPNTATVRNAELSSFDSPGADFGPGNPACLDDTAPYYIWTPDDCQVRLRAEIDFGANVPALPREVRARLNAPFGTNCTGGQTLDLRNGWWESPWFTITAASGQNRFYMCWSAGNGNNFGGDFGGGTIQMAFAASTGAQSNTVFSGPVVATSILPSHSYAKAAQTVSISVGIQPPLRVSDGNAKPVLLRISGSGSLNQALDCDPSPIGIIDEVRDGCQTPYQVNTRNLECSPNPTWDTNNLPPTLDPEDPAWIDPDCIEANPGDVTSMARGLRQRFEDPPPVGRDCPANQWDAYRAAGEVPEPEDPRWVTLVIAEYGTFAGQGIFVLPITKFAGFYASGWFVGGGAQGTQGCPDNDPPPPCPDPSDPQGPLCDPANSRYQGAVWGYFITTVVPRPARPSDELCVFNDLGECMAVLVE